MQKHTPIQGSRVPHVRFRSRSVSEPSPGLGHKSTFRHHEGKEQLSQDGHRQQPMETLCTPSPLQTPILPNLSTDRST